MFCLFIYNSPASGGIKGGMGAFAPQSKALLPVRRKKWPKSAIFGNFLDFYSLRITFCPLDAPHKKFLVPPLSPAITGIISVWEPVCLRLPFQTLPEESDRPKLKMLYMMGKVEEEVCIVQKGYSKSWDLSHYFGSHIHRIMQWNCHLNYICRNRTSLKVTGHKMIKGTDHDFCWSGKPIYHLQKQGNTHIFQNKYQNSHKFAEIMKKNRVFVKFHSWGHSNSVFNFLNF